MIPFRNQWYSKTQCECPLDRLLEQLAKLPKVEGVLIAATDTLMTKFDWTTIDASCFTASTVTGVGIHAPWDFGTRHGVYYTKRSIDGQTKSFGILQKANEQMLRFFGAVDEKEEVLLDSGIVHLGKNVVTALLGLTSTAPFIGLTKRGIDTGVQRPVRFELYTDLLGALKEVWPKEEYLSSSVNKEEEGIRLSLSAALNEYAFAVLELSPDCEFIHVGTTHEHRELAVGSAFYSALDLTRRCRSYESAGSEVVCAKTAVLINSHVSGIPGQSHVDEFAVVEHSRLHGFFKVGKGAVVSQVDATNVCVEEGMVLQQIPVHLDKIQSRFPLESEEHQFIQSAIGDARSKSKEYCVYVIFGVNDGIKDEFPKGTFGNRAWTEMEQLAKHIWPSSTTERSLWTARLFPLVEKGNVSQEEAALWLLKRHLPMDRMLKTRWKSAFRVSISDLVWIADVNATVEWKYHRLPSIVFTDRIIQAIVNRTAYPKDCFPLHLSDPNPSSSSIGKTDRARALLRALDEICYTLTDDSLCARALSLVADMLAGDREPRSGDAGHPEFAPLLLALARSSPASAGRRRAILRLAALRDSPYWSASLDSLSRAARHYDTASQSLTGHCLFTESLQLPSSSQPIEEDVWVHSTAPARIDLAGGWSDTPPITNESGGIVCNVAITLEPNVPCLGASARRFSVPGNRSTFILRIGRFDALPKSPEDIVTCTSAKDFEDHFNPRAPGALGKCVLLALMDLNRLMELGFGLELCLWSDLPPGSGLGGSSILSACAALAASHVLGIVLTRQDIVKVVLKVEQLLSTGGGWQDQIGAIYPEFKITRSEARLPIRVDVFPLPASPQFVSEFQSRVILVQTGPARLARDLLQNVVRRWHRREPEFIQAIDSLRETAKRMSEAIIHGRIDNLSKELNAYWKLKKFVTGKDQAEPSLIRDLFTKTEHLTVARSLCGAGGGGFAVFVVKEGVEFQEFKRAVSEAFPDMIVHHAYVCRSGLNGWREDQPEYKFKL